MPMPCTPAPATTLRVNCIRLRTPSGVAWPTVSERQRREAPWSMAVRKSVESTSGRERVVSSVTYATGRPALTPTSMASALRFAMRFTSHSSAYWRMGLDPMNA